MGKECSLNLDCSTGSTIRGLTITPSSIQKLQQQQQKTLNTKDSGKQISKKETGA